LSDLAIHRKVYELLGFGVAVCSEVDRLVDVEPPMAEKVESGWRGEERLCRRFGFRKRLSV
jgi:hypothetical protein